MNKILQKISLALLVIAVLGLGLVLFFDVSLNSLILLQNKQSHSQEKVTIAYSVKPDNLNPFTNSRITRSMLLDVYESLVFIDKDYNLKPSLALSWGRISDFEYQFIIRKGVKFHNGQDLKLEDIKYSLEYAANSELANLVENIEQIIISSEDTITIQLSQKDPLLPLKLSRIPIVKSNFTNWSMPNGTGKYKVENADDLNSIDYSKNESYRESLNISEKVNIIVINNKVQRVEALKEQTIDFLADVPPDLADDFENDSNVYIKTVPSLEIGFLLFNLSDSFFSQKNNRVRVGSAINKNDFLELFNGYAQPVNQFVSSGVFGYNPDLQVDYNFTQQNQGIVLDTVTFSYPMNLPLLGEFVKNNLRDVGINVQLNPLSISEFNQGFLNGDYQFFYLGWRNQFADSIDFLKQVAHTNNGDYGNFNLINYSNPNVDELIVESEQNLDQEARLAQMQRIMEIIVKEDIIGIPLFETKYIFAMRDYIQFDVRVDGFIYPSSINVIK